MLQKVTNNYITKINNENLKVIISRMTGSQIKTFNQSYEEKIQFGKLVYSKKLKN